MLIQDILDIATHDDSNLQTAFDILGETIKFNKRTLLILEANIRSELLDQFKEKCLSHLGDSNVFIRGILLTMYKHTSENKNIDDDREYLFD